LRQLEGFRAVDASQSNPFATRYTRPGELPFIFDEETEDGLATVEKLLSRLRELGWWAEIVGPHGSGKTTLLTHLLKAVRNTGMAISLFTLRDGQRRLPRGWQAMIQAGSLIAIDGYEQLRYVARWRVKRRCRQEGAGLIVTAHSSMRLPTLYRTHASLEVSRQVIERLLPHGAPRPSDDELVHLLDVFHGNLREVLFALYDRYEPPQQA